MRRLSSIAMLCHQRKPGTSHTSASHLINEGSRELPLPRAVNVKQPSGEGGEP